MTDIGLSPGPDFFASMKYVVLIFTFLMADVEVPLEETKAKMNETKIVELVLFNLNDGVSLEEGKKAMKALNEFVSQQAGFVSRKTSVAEDGQFLDLVFWTDLQSAKAASEKAMQEQSIMPHFSVINQESMTFKHFEAFMDR
ncbi:MAG: hypothetical protein R8G66_24650 [Cytophagales bacterium]|nr:hypothetical protein [Cytophagales bacterium]